MHIRNFGHGMGLSWQVAFQTDDPAQVERHCAAHGMQWRWGEHGGLQTRHVRSVSLRHPVTGEPVWFNHGTFFHVSTLEPGVRDVLLAQFGAYELPTNTFYGDGTEIEPETLDTLRSIYRQATVAFDWQTGDMLVLDNMLMAHGRAPYRGERTVLVAMAAQMGWEDVETPGGTWTP